MLKTTPTQSAKTLPLDMAKDAKVESGMSSTTRLAENSPSNMGGDVEFVGNSDGGDNKTIKRLIFSKKSNILIGYLTFLRSGKR